MQLLAGLLTKGVADVGGGHLQSVVNHVGPITEVEVQERMREAAVLHAREWDRSPHPCDLQVPPQAHDWAVYHIAVNLVARDRGYDVGHPRYAMPRQLTTVATSPSLRPMRRAGGDY
jgi:hypothetical protein